MLHAGTAPAHPRFCFRHYDDQHGLSNLDVTSLVQDKIGFLWVGTQDGLHRFDGDRFTRFGRSDGLPSTFVRGMHLAPDGTLWVATEGGLARWNGKSFKAYGPAVGLPADPIPANGIAAGTEGQLYVGTNDGVYRQVGERFEPLAEAGTEDRAPVTTLCVGPDSALWFATAGSLIRLHNGVRTAWHVEDGLPQERIDALLFDKEGALWVRSHHSLVTLDPGERKLVEHGGGLPPSNYTASLYQDRGGTIWVPTDIGLARRKPDGAWDIIDHRRGLLVDPVHTVIECREGLIWIGLAGGGLACWLGYPSWEAYTTAEGLSNDTVWSVARDATGQIWAGTDRGLNRFDQPSHCWRSIQRSDGLAGECAYALLPCEEGALWVGFLPGGVSRIDVRTGQVRSYGLDDGLLDDHVYSLAMTGAGTLWVATTRGLFRGDLDGTRCRFEREDVPGGESGERFLSLLVDDLGRLWAGGRRGLAMLELGRWRRFTTGDGLKADEVGSLSRGAGGSIWATYWEPLGASRLRLDGGSIKLEHVDASTGLTSDSVVSVAEGPDGSAWFATSLGVNVLKDGRMRHFTRDDGLVWNSANMIFPDADGGLWVGTARGLSHSSTPAGGPREPPAIVLLSASFGATRIWPDGATTVPYSRDALEVHYAGLVFEKPASARFRYRLVGYDIAPSETDQRAVRYPRLPPGEYEFEVRCRDAFGMWSDAPARLSFVIRPPWYQTHAAYLGGVCVLMLLGGLAYTLRVRMLLETKRRLEVAVEQRTAELETEKRMVEDRDRALMEAAEERGRFYATVVHDLKNPLTPIIGGLEVLDEELPTGNTGLRRYLESVRHASGRLAFLIDSLTSSLRAPTGQMASNFDAIRAHDLVADVALSYWPTAKNRGLLLRVHGVRVEESWSAPRGGPLLHAPVHATYRAMENILSNALKYAATEIRILVIEEADRIGLCIEDDGPGIPDADKERVFEMYAQLDDSKPGSGVGLASARAQVESFGGAIRVLDVAPHGARFEIWVPRRT